MSKVDELLLQLNNESKYNPLNESVDLSFVTDKFNSLKKQLLASQGLINSSLNDDQLRIIREVKKISIDDSFRVVTYPNIHYERKYKIDASVLFDFVMRKIDENAKNGGENFSATDVVHEAISYALKYLTGSTPAKRITIDEFKKCYQLHAFGSYRKIQMKPRILPLTILAERNPLILSYIDNKLLVNQINRISDYAKKVESDFSRLLKNDDNLKYILTSYTSCIERSIRALINIYKIIRNTFIELQNEYFVIFNQVKRLSNMSDRFYNECCVDTNNFLNKLNNNIKNQSNTLNESVDTDNESMIETMGIEFMNMIQNKINNSQSVRDFIYKNIGLVTKIDTNEKYELLIPRGLYSLDESRIKSFINTIPEITTDNLSIKENIKKSSIMLYNNEEVDDINSLRKIVKESISGNDSTVSLTIDDLTNNVLKLLSLLSYIDDNYYKTLIDKYRDDMANYENNSNKLYHFKNTIIPIMVIVDSIYFNILDLLEYFINMIIYNLI